MGVTWSSAVEIVCWLLLLFYPAYTVHLEVWFASLVCLFQKKEALQNKMSFQCLV